MKGKEKTKSSVLHSISIELICLYERCCHLWTVPAVFSFVSQPPRPGSVKRRNRWFFGVQFATCFLPRRQFLRKQWPCQGYYRLYCSLGWSYLHGGTSSKFFPSAFVMVLYWTCPFGQDHLVGDQQEKWCSFPWPFRSQQSMSCPKGITLANLQQAFRARKCQPYNCLTVDRLTGLLPRSARQSLTLDSDMFTDPSTEEASTDGDRFLCDGVSIGVG